MARPSDPSKKKKIVTAAITTFARKGYAGARIAEVAEAAGIGKGTIYEYFRSKEDLFFATFEHLMSDTGILMEKVVQSATGTASKRLVAMADAVITTWLANLDIYGLVLEFWSATAAAPGRKRFQALFRSVYSELRTVVAELIRNGMEVEEFKADIEPEKIASALIGSWDALLLQAWLDSEFDPLGASQSHMKVVLAGLRRTTTADED
jgi:AcrR family transcriptional regulator